MISILENVTEEQLLDFFLDYVANSNSDETTHIVPEKIICNYAINEVGKDQETFTEEDVLERYKELITSHILTKMVKDGLVEVDLSKEDPKYILSEEGKKHVNKDG